jgi:hypothetical protein
VPDVDDLIGLRAMRPEAAAPVAALIRAALAAQSVVTDPLPWALRVTEADVTEPLRSGGGGVAEPPDGLAGPALWAEQDGGRYLGRLAVAPPRVAAGSRRLRRRPRRRCARCACPHMHLSTRLVLLDNRRLFVACGYVEAPFVNMEKRLIP